jgi:hypothetical protein
VGKDSALDKKEVSTREGSAQDIKRVKFQSTIRRRFGFRMGKILKKKGKDLGCGVAHRVRRGSDKGGGVAQTVARRLAVRQARVRISAQHPRGGPLPSGSNEEIKSGARRVVYIKYYISARIM